MNEDDRLNPEELLEAVRREENNKNKGKLKIFLGMAAGVGKTYAMLEAAQKLVKEKEDVAIGIVDTHGRSETAKLMEGIRSIPEKWMTYKDTLFEEMDIDEVIRQKPKLVLVDELAHSNVPGSRHLKRWQDVIEILDHGIDVYTTLNVQHIESLKDIVEKITGVVIRETVPDMIVEKAANIELIDLTPNELLQRLKEGKVYLGDQSIIAARHFFQEDRLTALREIVLRYAAEKIDHDLQGMVSTVQRSSGWKPRERLLVAVSHSPYSQKLVRITRRLAFTLDAPWIAVHVDDGRILGDADRAMLDKNISLARELGGEVITTSDSDIVQGLLRVARQKSVSQIVIGRSPKRSLYDFFQNNSLLDRLIKESSDIDVHVIRTTSFARPVSSFFSQWHLSKQFDSYALVILSVLALTLFNWFFVSILGYKLVGFIFLLSVLALSLFFKKGPVFVASLVSAIMWSFLFVPRDSGREMSEEDIAFLVLFFLTAGVTGILTDRVKLHQEMLAKREKSIRALYEIVRDIADSPTQMSLLSSIKEHLSSVLDGNCDIILKGIDGDLHFDETQTLLIDDKERAAATWVFQNKKEGGWSTATLPMAYNLYIPLKGVHEAVGVLAYHPKDARILTLEEKNFMYTVIQQLSHHLERSFAEEKANKQANIKQTEKVYQSILNLIYSLFESPLLSIRESVKPLIKESKFSKESLMLPHLEQIETASESLMHILENIDATGRLSAEHMPMKKNVQNIENLIKKCVERAQKSTVNHQLHTRIQSNLPQVPFDNDLIELLLYNLIFNAAEYSPPNSHIEVEAHTHSEYLVISVIDEGQGVPPEQIESIFEKFYRIPGENSQGLGLGLSIAKTIAELHGGYLKAQNRELGGMIFSLYLPISTNTIYKK